MTTPTKGECDQLREEIIKPLLEIMRKAYDLGWEEFSDDILIVKSKIERDIQNMEHNLYDLDVMHDTDWWTRDKAN
jgi:hypothetical protein